MGEYQGRINLSKEDIRFVVNEIFEANASDNTSKEKLLKIAVSLYKEENYDKILKMLPFEGYKTLEQLIKFVGENGKKEKNADIKAFIKECDFRGFRELEKVLIVCVRAKYGEYLYNVNEDILDGLQGLFTEKNRNIANRYGLMEKLILGMLYTYGVVNFEFFRKELSRHMKEIISKEEIYDFIFYRLNLNPLAETRMIHWTNINEKDELITYLMDEIDDYDRVISIFTEQKSRDWEYKLFTKKELMNRNRYLSNENSDKLCNFIKKKDCYFSDYDMQVYNKSVELGENVLEELLDEYEFEEEEIQSFISLYMEWYNNMPQYELGGYSPMELAKKMY